MQNISQKRVNLPKFVTMDIRKYAFAAASFIIVYSGVPQSASATALASSSVSCYISSTESTHTCVSASVSGLASASVEVASSESVLSFVEASRSVIAFVEASASELMSTDGVTDAKDFEEALLLYDRGVYSQAMYIFDDIASRTGSPDAKGYSVLCSVSLDSAGYLSRIEGFVGDYPYSRLIPQMWFRHACNLFEKSEYEQALNYFSSISEKSLRRSQRDEYIFKKSYSALETERLDEAMAGFLEIDGRKRQSDYTAPAQYSIGYIHYKKNEFEQAIDFLRKSSKDSRFTDMADYYILECRFMLEDYRYVTAHGPEMYMKVPDDRKPRLARIISESYLVLGDSYSARHYYDLNLAGSSSKSDSDYFYAGSVLYAVADYSGAIDNFSKMSFRADSVGQVANYHLGYSYIQTKNKVAAMKSFKEASEVSFDPQVTKDAFFNYAKLAFDLNHDPSAFSEYLEKYPDVKRNATIYSYMAVAALYNKDYASAIDYYSEIDELDSDMKRNYVKANYLRATQLINAGSYRTAIPCLKAAAYYGGKRDNLTMYSHYWLAESYYRNENYALARETIESLYNMSALNGKSEGYLLPYNMAYCFFREGNYPSAIKWFDEYLSEPQVTYRRDAMERRADCVFMQKNYRDAAAAYENVVKVYPDTGNLYSYLQAGVSYGLAGSADKKIAVLEKTLSAKPDAKCYADALFELGRAYVEKDRETDASACFERIVNDVPDSVQVAKSLIELGMIARNGGDRDKAMSCYKRVVESVPDTEYAQDALLAIESVYQSEGRPEEYLAYIESIGKGSVKSEDEREAMIFNSAEQVYLSEDYRKAAGMLQNYMAKYPQGKNLYKAEFYMAECLKETGSKEKARDWYEKVIEDGHGTFVELSMLNFAAISYELERYREAYMSYSSLYAKATLPNNRSTALVGMLRSAYWGKLYEEAINAAVAIERDSSISEQYGVEAEYVRAKSLMATSRRDDALKLLEHLSLMPETAKGAEARYILIQDAFDRADYAKVETMVYDFSDTATPQTYWLAKSFLLLGDSFMERGNVAQAKATFESLRDGYDADDEVSEGVAMRLGKIARM